MGIAWISPAGVTAINRAMYREEMRARRVRALSSPLTRMLAYCALALLATWCAWAILNGLYKPAEFMAVLALLMGAAASIKPLSRLSDQVYESAAAAENVLDMLALAAEFHPTSDRLKPALPRHRASIAFESVTYAYPGQAEPAVRDVSLTVSHGQTIALVGCNGSGKSTLLALLPRLLNPKQGRVLVDGQDIALASLRSLRQQIGVVTQQTVLFEGTIEENIAYGRRHAPRAAVLAAATAAFADEFIRELPLGYETPLGEGGSGLSGGQRQRLCIARALLRDPAVMILDEATSQIDGHSEQRIHEALRGLRGHCTTFIIAHRLATVIDADRILVMDGGRVVDHGSHEELLARCRLYQLLTRTQLQDAPA